MQDLEEQSENGMSMGVSGIPSPYQDEDEIDPDLDEDFEDTDDGFEEDEDVFGDVFGDEPPF